jgi:outer membrane receptor protein involved in Fe transport
VEQANEARRAITSNDPTFTDSRNQLLSLHQSFAFNPRWSLSSISAGFDTTTRLVSDYDYTANPGAFFDSLQAARAVSQELRLRYEGRQLRAVIGAYGYDAEEDEVADLLVDLPTFARVLNLCRTGVECLALQGQSINAHTEYPTQNRNLALFGEADWQVAERLTLTAGLRYDRERVQRTNVFVTTPNGAGAAAFLAALRAANVVGPDGAFPIDKSFTALLPKLAAVYEVHPGWFANASVRRGYRAGGAARNVVGGFNYEFDPEYTNSYEVGIKATPLKRVNVSLTVFRTDWLDMQVFTGLGTTARVENAGRARIDGVELEARARLLPRLSTSFALGLLDGRFKAFQSGTSGDLSGKRLPYAPRHTGSIALDYKPFKGAFIRPEVQFQGGGFGGPENDPEQKLDARGLVNLKLGWAAGGANLYFTGTNLANDNYRTDAYFNQLGNANIASLGVGRVLGAGLDYQF